MLDPHFVIAGAVLNLIGSTTYAYQTVRGRTKPNRISWLLWALAPLVAFGAEINQGVGLASLMTFMVGFGPLVIFIASFVNRKAFWNITRFDIVCGALSVVALILWVLTRSGNVAIALSIAADALAAIPTLVKSFRDPASENPTVFMFGGLSAGITLLTLKVWDFQYYAFPLYIFLICALLFVLIKFPKLRPAHA